MIACVRNRQNCKISCTKCLGIHSSSAWRVYVRTVLLKQIFSINQLIQYFQRSGLNDLFMNQTGSQDQLTDLIKLHSLIAK